MRSRHLHSIQRAFSASVMLLLGACSGLPGGGKRISSTAIKGTKRTPLAVRVRPLVAAHPGQSGVHALANGRDALAARIALADTAQRSLDVQYFIWNKDMAGKVLLEHLLRAADRGVRVRMLLDDLGTMPSDEILLAIDSHPNVEVRMFNPVATRKLRVLGALADFGRINRRMHNKSFTADGQIAIVGGRNIGDEYFDASEGANFADLDAAVVGPVVSEVSDAFDLYWNHQAAIPIGTLSRQNTTAEGLAASRAGLLAHEAGEQGSSYVKTMRESEFVRQMRNHAVGYIWGRATIMADHPDKVVTSAAETRTHLAPKLRELVEGTKRELFLVSPYFVPGKEGVALIVGARQRGVRVVVVTNSLASTDALAVQSGYQRYRKELLAAGVELYETKPTVGAKHDQHSGGGIGSSGGSHGASLHAKTFAFDRRIVFIGSYNLDPRSSRLNTEMGVKIESPELAARLPAKMEHDMIRTTYRLELEGDRLVWVTREGETPVRLHSEPGASFGKRLKVRVMSWLPIEGLL